MEREHLIIIVLILVALYMTNNDDDSKTVCAWGPLGRIRYEGDATLDPNRPLGHIRTREGFVEDTGEIGHLGHIRTREGFVGDALVADGAMGQRIRYSDKHFAHSQHIKNHIRNRNRNSMFSGMMAGEISGDSAGQIV
jgi:hypothetical protein